MTDDIIVHGFRENGYIEWNGDRAQLHSWLRTAIESRNVPAEVLEEVDRLITAMRDTENEIVHDADDAASDIDDKVLVVDIVDSASHEIELPSPLGPDEGDTYEFKSDDSDSEDIDVM